MTKGPYHLLLLWLLFTGIVIFAVIVAWQENVLAVLFISDKSKISWAIALLYILVTVHCAKRAYAISSEINDANIVESMIKNSTMLELNMQDDKVHLNENSILPGCTVTTYVHDLLNKATSEKERSDINIANSELIEVYESKLKGPHSIGWFVADLMIKMGLLGTIIGFIYMLGSVANITDFDVTSMQKILRHMSTGMGTALYTTLTGLVCSILTSAQYHMLDGSVDELIDTTKHLTQVYVLPKLR